MKNSVNRDQSLCRRRSRFTFDRGWSGGCRRHDEQEVAGAGLGRGDPVLCPAGVLLPLTDRGLEGLDPRLDGLAPGAPELVLPLVAGVVALALEPQQLGSALVDVLRGDDDGLGHVVLLKQQGFNCNVQDCYIPVLQPSQ